MPKTLQTLLLALALVTPFALYFITTGESAEKRRTETNTTEAEPKTTAPVKPKQKPKHPAETVEQKKSRFLNEIVPAVVEAKKRLAQTYAAVKAYEQNRSGSLTEGDIRALMESYRVQGLPCLLSRLRTNPTSVVVAQAALETGWGTSRFYKEANNVFGIWSYNPNEPRMAASKTRDGRVIYVKKYASLEASIEGYFKMIALGRSYEALRNERAKTDDPYLLITKLNHYSELRDAYIARLYAVIRSNDLTRFDAKSFTAPPLAVLLPEYVASKKAKEQAADLKALEELKQCEENASVAPCGDDETAETNLTVPSPALATAAPAH